MSTFVVVLVTACTAPTLRMRSPVGSFAGMVAETPGVSADTLSPPYATLAQRIAVVDWMATLIADRFHDPRLNNVDFKAATAQAKAGAAAAQSDQALYVALKSLAAAVKDSHTTVLTPRETADARRFVSTRLGFVLTTIDGQVVIAEVERDGAAWQVGLTAGDVVQAINGVVLGAAAGTGAAEGTDTGTDANTGEVTVAGGAAPDAPAVIDPAALPPVLPYAGDVPVDPGDARRVRSLQAALDALRRPPDAMPQPLRLRVASDGGAPRELSLTPLRSERATKVTLQWLDDRIALLQFNRFQQQSVDALRQALENLSGARAVIIDLRGNAGGNFEVFRWFAGRFMPEPRQALRVAERNKPGATSQRVSVLQVSPAASGPLLPGAPMAVLIDGRTASAAELAAVTLAEQRAAVLIGEPSCGCATGVRNEIVLPDGGGLRIAELGFQSAQGARFEGAPTQPAVRVIASRDDLRTGRDPVREEALRRLIARLARYPDSSAR